MPVRWIVFALAALLPGRALATGVMEYAGSFPTGCAHEDPPQGQLVGTVMSPDGDLYEVRSQGAGHWRHDPTTGALLHRTYPLGDPRLVVPSLPSLYSSFRFSTVTADGRHLLLAVPVDDAGNWRVVVVERDVGTGVLGAVAQDVAIHSPSAVLSSPDSRHVYVAGAHPSGGGRAIQMFERNAIDGALTDLGSTPAQPSSRFLGMASSSDGLQVYASVYSIDYQDGDPYRNILLEVWSRDPTTGGLSLLQTSTVMRSGDTTVDDRHYNSVIVSPDGADLYLPKGGDANGVVRFRRDAATGLLTAAGVLYFPGPDSFVNQRAVIRPDGAFLYFASGAVLARDAVTGGLTYAGRVPGRSLVPGSWPPSWPFGFAGNTKMLVAGPRAFDFGSPTGFGPLVDDDDERSADAAGPLAITPDAAHLYVACPWEDAIAGHAIDPATGLLVPAGKLVDGGGDLTGASHDPAINPLAVSPDGAHVYAGSLHGTGIATLARNAATGELTFVGAVRQDEAGVDGIGRVTHFALSSDGSFLYASSSDPDRPVTVTRGHLTIEVGDMVTVFSRDAGTGVLTQVQAVPRVVYPRVRLTNEAFVAIPAGDQQVFVSSIGSQASVFSRNPVTGMLGEEETLKTGGLPIVGPDPLHLYLSYPPGVRGIGVRRYDPVRGTLSTIQNLASGSWPSSVGVDGPLTIGGDGDYAHGISDFDGLVTLRRDPVTGMLGSVQRLDDGADTARYFVVTSADGRHVYAVDRAANVILHYRRREPCAPAPLAGCLVPMQPGAASLLLVDQPGARDNVKLRWTRGTAVTRAELGAPDVDTDYVACVYDAAGPQPASSILVPAGQSCRDEPCWQWRGQGYTYRSVDRTPDGVARVTVKPGIDGTTSLRWQANKGSVPPLGLPLDAPVVVQIQASNGTCWEASFSNLRVNDGSRLVARSD